MPDRPAPAPLEYGTRPQRQSVRPLFLVAVALSLLGFFGLVVPYRCGNRPEAALRARAMIDISMIENALDSFEDDTGRLPTLAQGLDALMRAPDGIDHWRGPYLKRLPGDPWGSPYLYCPAQRGTGTGIVFSMGPDGRLGTFDDLSMTQPFESGERGSAFSPTTLPR